MHSPLQWDTRCQFEHWTVTSALSLEGFAPIRRRLILDGYKWDPQVGDVSTLAPFAIVLPGEVWKNLALLAEELTREALAAEKELLDHPELFHRLGLADHIARAMASPMPTTSRAGRVFRFDFHPTPDGWRISEANSDVPGGYTEASLFPQLMAEHFKGLAPAGNPGLRLADHIVEVMRGPGHVALLCATGYMEDQQVIAFLGSLLRERGCKTYRAHPRQLHWKNGAAHLRCRTYSGPINGIVRFFQGEWLCRLPPVCGWPCYFRGGLTPICNPGSALLIESKRFPLVWDQLSMRLPTWRALLPETRHPREVRWRRDPDWLLKTSFCNTGDTVTIRALVDRRSWFSAASQALFWPRYWIAQKRFQVSPLSTPAGLMYPCLGVYTVSGRAAGIYGRLSHRPVIDYSAMDVAVLIPKEGIACENSDSRNHVNGQARAL